MAVSAKVLVQHAQTLNSGDVHTTLFVWNWYTAKPKSIHEAIAYDKTYKVDHHERLPCPFLPLPLALAV